MHCHNPQNISRIQEKLVNKPLLSHPIVVVDFAYVAGTVIVEEDYWEVTRFELGLELT